MKFLIAKNDKLFCLHCKSIIYYGEHYIGVFYKKNFQGIVRRNNLIFHVDCYRAWADENVVKRYLAFKESLDPPKKRGRPFRYRDGKEANRIKTLIKYHEKAGDSVKAGRLMIRLLRLRV